MLVRKKLFRHSKPIAGLARKVYCAFLLCTCLIVPAKQVSASAGTSDEQSPVLAGTAAPIGVVGVTRLLDAFLEANFQTLLATPIHLEWASVFRNPENASVSVREVGERVDLLFYRGRYALVYEQTFDTSVNFSFFEYWNGHLGWVGAVDDFKRPRTVFAEMDAPAYSVCEHPKLLYGVITPMAVAHVGKRNLRFQSVNDPSPWADLIAKHLTELNKLNKEEIVLSVEFPVPAGVLMKATFDAGSLWQPREVLSRNLSEVRVEYRLETNSCGSFALPSKVRYWHDPSIRPTDLAGAPSIEMRLESFDVLSPLQFEAEMERWVSDIAALEQGDPHLGPQGESVLCGPMALQHLLLRLGKDVDLDDILSLVPVEEDGTSLYNLRMAASEWGVQLVPVEASLTHLMESTGPSILHLRHNHFVMAEQLTGSEVKVYDLPYAPKVVPFTVLEDLFSGRALMLQDGVPALDDAPELISVEPVLQMGGLPVGASVPVLWPIRNTGNSDLTVVASPVVAGLVPEVPSLVVAPGAEDVLQFRLDVDATGAFFHEALLETNDPHLRGSRLGVAATGFQEHRMGPTNVFFGTVFAGSSETRLVRLSRMGLQTEDLPEIRASDPAISGEVIGHGGGTVTVRVRLNPLQAGSFRGSLAVDGVQQRVGVFADVLPRFHAIPSLVPLGILEPGDQTDVTVAVLAETGFQIHNVVTDAPWGSVGEFAAVKHEQGTTIYANLLCGPTLPNIPEGNLLITILSDGEENQVISVPMLGLRLPQPKHGHIGAVAGARP